MLTSEYIIYLSHLIMALQLTINLSLRRPTSLNGQIQKKQNAFEAYLLRHTLVLFRSFA